MMEFRRVRRGL